MHFGYFGLTLVPFYIYFSHLRGALGHFGVLYMVLIRIDCDSKGPKGSGDQLAVARWVRGWRREGDFGASLAHFGVGWGSLRALWGCSAYVKMMFVYSGLTLVKWWSHFGCKKVCF